MFVQEDFPPHPHANAEPVWGSCAGPAFMSSLDNSG